VAVITRNPRRRDGLAPTYTAVEMGKRTSIERFFGYILVYFHLQRPPVFDWSAVETQVALTYAAVWILAMAHVWEGVELRISVTEGKLAASEASGHIISIHGRPSQG
jgi:hypothetical protein